MVERLLAWFEAHGRDLPWRRTRDPYAILVSEVMLQQTQAARVVPRYLAWLERWPTVEALAAASTADVLREWQGLGYNRRAVSLQRAAREVAANGWPEDLTTLPGVGRYTADAVACFAFDRPGLPLDVNVRRVLERTRASFAFRTDAANRELQLRPSRDRRRGSDQRRDRPARPRGPQLVAARRPRPRARRSARGARRVAAAAGRRHGRLRPDAAGSGHARAAPRTRDRGRGATDRGGRAAVRRARPGSGRRGAPPHVLALLPTLPD